MIILGLNAYHGDSSACIVMDGKLICAIEEERIRRIKHWAGLPTESIKGCLQYAGLDIKDIDCIAISRDPSAHIHKKFLRILTRTPKVSFLKNRFQNASRIHDIKKLIADTLNVDVTNIKAELKRIEHHRAHLGSAFLVSPFDEAVCVSVDGFGDFVSTMTAVGRGNKVEIQDWVEFPHSLGIFYTAMTQFLGFWHYGDEYKVMGLCAFGDPEYKQEIEKIIKRKRDGLFELDTSYFLHDKEGIDMLWDNGSPEIGRLFSDKLVAIFGKPREKDEDITERHQNIAASVQAVYEDTFFHILNYMYEKTKLDKITLTGGCIQNSLANGRIFEKTPFEEVYIAPASHDAGTAIGSAFTVWNIIQGNKREFVMDQPYWGQEYSNGDIIKLIDNNSIDIIKMTEDEIVTKAAKDIADGKIVGWFQGRTEWGPRALGNRSILVDPRRVEMKELLNQRIKRREAFRPFASSILEEYVSEWFEHAYRVPFMEKVYLIKPEKRKDIPAVTHHDGTGRLHTVSKDINPRFYKLIEAFQKLTGVPLVLNTSFNENEPIVNTPQDALDCFMRTRMNVLVMSDYSITRS